MFFLSLLISGGLPQVPLKNKSNMNSNYIPFIENKWKVNLTAVHKLCDKFPLKITISVVG